MENVGLRKQKILIPIITAIAVTGFWITLTDQFYSYNHFVLRIGGNVLFPAISWFLGFILLHWVFQKISSKKKNLLQSFLLVIALYWMVLFFLESSAYHILNIRNLNTASYAGLPFCDCLHAPPWMQIGYFTIGPVYLLVTIALKKLQS